MFSLTSRKISHETTVVEENYQLMSVVDETVPNFQYHVILVYLSSECNLSQVVDHLSHLLIPGMTTIITGDFNFDQKGTNVLTFFLEINFFYHFVFIKF